ncbi:MAG: ribosome biogenesis/translation initiation ATPase RLI [Candidatus Micrarchaeia archaeon]|jgi:ATP-binding cassette subfamily E protein 1
MRLAIIDKRKCRKKDCGYICQKFCPGVRMGDETVTVNSDEFPEISEILCTGCGICANKCPEHAITIINLTEETGKPIYQYGINSFRLYKLPLPREGVLGLIGKNGIGKSTALNILSKKIIPNFGEYEKNYTLEEAIQKMGNIEQAYFKSLNLNEIEVSHKPQHVDKISEIFEGTVKELLNKVDGNNLEKAVKEFQLEKILNRQINKLSGGELQRIAIAAAYMKKADIYYFDEPASYLDIEQRMEMSKKLKELSKTKKVVVIEHDMALLDYMCDYVNIFYGYENAYGIVSGVKAARAGVNEYLQGYLKDENIRFRDYEINFEKRSSSDTKKTLIGIEYPEFEKSFENFKFKSEEGKINLGETIGILGRNAIGKTLFIKMLAGVEKPDNTEYDMNLKIAYKPQYVKVDEDMQVKELFASKKLDNFVFKEAQRRLGIEGLMDKFLSQLSGGELQRVAITLTLSQEADIYLFDEPSAFLDIEQRLHFVQLIRSIIGNSETKSAFVVDHDIVLIDLISDRLMIFEGESSSHGKTSAPLKKKQGMNLFLKGMDITMRRDKDTLRPRINKQDSALDREQKQKGEYYYSF